MEFRSAIGHDGGEYNVAVFLSFMDLVWLLAEAGVALALLLGIVWWTWPRRRDVKPEDARGEDDRGG